MKNPAYAKVKPLVLSGYIKSLRGIYPDIDKATLQKDLELGWQGLTMRFNDPNRWTLKQLRRIADLLDMDIHQIVDLAMADAPPVKKKKS